jgi:uncharacterized membrane protein
MEDRAAVLTGMGVGAGLMYLFDPQLGRRRRALVRDKAVRSAHLGVDAMGATGRDAAHRASGAAARAKSLFDREPVDDVVLVDRIRARLGRLVSHPHAITVEAFDGCVTLRGPILQAEVKRLLNDVSRVPGVCGLVDDLEVHKEAGNVPALQGGGAPAIRRPDILQREWAPTTRMLACTTGTALTTYGVYRRDIPGTLLAVAGLGLVARASTNLDARRLTGIGAGRRSVDVQKTITIDAAVEDVFAFWTNYENFPQFMSRVLEVRPSTREGQSHWKVAGPAGLPIEFDAEVSAYVLNRVFGWRTVEGSPVAHAGLVRFEPAEHGGTRVQIRMSYNPPGGWLGHGVALAFGVDPKSSLDADLARAKTLLETGRPARDAARP